MRGDALLSVLRARLTAEPDVVAAWLYGSQARGTATASSDVDVAILTGRGAPRALADLPLDLESSLEQVTGRPVQVLLLDRAPTDLIHRVLRDGVLLLDRDHTRRVHFEVAARNRYFDMTPVWRVYRRRGSSA